MELELGKVAEVIGGDLRGSPEKKIKGISTPENPEKDTIVFCQTEKEVERAKEKAGAIVSSLEVEGVDHIKVEDVKLSLARFLSFFFPEEHPSGISERAVIGEGTKLGVNVYIGPFVVVGKNVRIGNNVKIYPFTFIGDNTVIGDDSVIFSGVHIYRNTIIGKRVRIHSGAVIGADGFGYHIGREGITKLNHIGVVVIEDDVEIGANTTVDRALLESTVIGRGTKIDNLVMVAHNCKIGENNILVSQVGLSGSVRTGRGVILAGQVGVADHVNIGDNVVVTAKSGVASDLKPNKTYGANLPAIEWSRWKRIYIYLLKLPELFRKLKGS